MLLSIYLNFMIILLQTSQLNNLILIFRKTDTFGYFFRGYFDRFPYML
jgi:hypothetical protein